VRHNDEYTITQAVIARHAQAGDARLREVMTSLVQHLHAFAREVQLTEAEWREGLRWLSEAGSAARPHELPLLSDVLGLSMLVTARSQRRAAGCTESTLAAAAAPCATPEDHAAAEPCYVRGQVRSQGGTPLPGARVQVWPCAAADGRTELPCDGAGRYRATTPLAQPCAVPHDGPVGRLLAALGRHPWRPAHLNFAVRAEGHRPLATQVFRDGDRYLETDAVFGVRRSLIAPWVRHESGPGPDGRPGPYHTLDFDFVLEAA
jgi:hydroxyquinol 1,2-dioxygenase